MLDRSFAERVSLCFLEEVPITIGGISVHVYIKYEDRSLMSSRNKWNGTGLTKDVVPNTLNGIAFYRSSILNITSNQWSIRIYTIEARTVP